MRCARARVHARASAHPPSRTTRASARTRGRAQTVANVSRRFSLERDARRSFRNASLARVDDADAVSNAPADAPSEFIVARSADEGADELERLILDFSSETRVGRDFGAKMDAVGAYFSRSPTELAGRTAEVLAVVGRVYALWTYEERMGTPLEKRRRGKALRDGVARLGPVFIKMAQTLSTRPDIIGEEAADNLMVLQDKVGPFSSSEADEIIKRELGWKGAVREKDAAKKGPAYSLYKELSDEPIAAASIGQVYAGVLHNGSKVAVKVQRPGMARRIALDLHIIRLGLVWIEESGLNGSEDLDKIVDEVGAGVFQELDYTIEARNADEFRKSLRFLNYLFVPRHYPDMTTKKVLTQQWISGRPMKNLSLDEQKLMVQMGVECSSAQLFRTGLVHADPHEGNMMFTDDGKLALLDFGLICRVDDEQQEAMANCILNILNSQWGELIDNLRIMQMLPEDPQMWVDANGNPADYTKDAGSWKIISDEEFRRAFKVCMDGEEGNPKVRANFTELVIDLTKISTSYRFNLPPYMVFIIRSLTTLDFAAARTNCNMYEVAAPTAIFRALSPRTDRGRKALEQMLLNKDGDVNWKKLLALSAQANTAAEQGGEGSSATDADVAHAKEAISRLVNDLVDSSAGSALRRLAKKARPEGLMPPPSIRDQLVQVTRASFARQMATFSFRAFFAAAFAFARSALSGAEAENEQCEVFTDDAERSSCNERVNRRRRRIGVLLLKSKLQTPQGFLSFCSILALLAWASVTGAFIGLRSKFEASARSLAAALRPSAPAPPTATA